jgi:hypothetical protein
MEAQDIAGQQQIGQAAIGQVQAQNITNPFAPGSPANLAELASQNAQLAGAAGQTLGQFGGNAGGPSTGGNVPGGTGGLNIGGPGNPATGIETSGIGNA